MSSAARSVLVFGLYLTPVGLGLLTMPNTVLGTLGFPASTEIWPRIVGMLTLAISYYYVQAARSELTVFFHWSIQVRTGVFLVCVTMVLLRLAPPPLAVLGVVDLLGAAWTAFALRAQART